MKPIIRRYLSISLSFVLILLLFLSALMPLHADAAQTFYPEAELYQSKDNETHSTQKQYRVDRFIYAKSPIGKLTLNGSASQEEPFEGYPTYSVNDKFVIGYSYNGSYLNNDKEQWNLESDSGKSAAGITLSHKIEKGTIIIQKSNNHYNWVDVIEPINDFFVAKKLDRSNLYTVTKEELKEGTFFRVILAYEMTRKVGTEKRWGPIPDKPIYESVYCTEVYQFYVCYEKDQIQFRELLTKKAIASGEAVKSGFIIDKNGSSNKVTVKHNGKDEVISGNITTVTEIGDYTIIVTNALGKTFTYNIQVTEGLTSASVSPTIYENQKKDKYTEDNRVSGGKPSFGLKPRTVLSIAHNSEIPVVSSKYKSRDAFGVNGSSVYLLLHLQQTQYSSWELVPDKWGKKSSELVDGVEVGAPVNTGALIVQTSSNGVNWKNEDLSRYSNGLYTTDFETHYGNAGDVMIYAPSGTAILNGLYVRVIYAYEIANKEAKKDLRCIEKYEFYLCSDNLDAVSFHNLSATEQLKEICEDYDDATSEVYQNAETMLSGSYTVTGFSIDTKLNPTVKFTVKKDGTEIATPSNREFKETGRYDIELTSAVGSKKNVTLYVDRMGTDEELAYYFGDCFIDGKRIYSEGKYAVYEGGVSSYNIKEIDDNHLPLGGYIKNTTTGEEIRVDFSRDAKTGVLTTPGRYEAVLTTSENESIAGDRRIITFRFELIANGTAPGPVVNQKSLAAYGNSTISDSYPIFYALTYQSAATGYITLAFANKEDALDYAYNFEKGMVEQQKDGTYRYTGSLYVTTKEKYDSTWDLTDALYYFAEQAVQIKYFDLSDEFTVLTLPETVIKDTENLRTLELSKSVTIFAPEEMSKLTNLDTLPIINAKPYSYLNPGRAGVVDSGFTDFEFVKDKYGCDSYKVTITDCEGKEYNIDYNTGVGHQLDELQCPSGIVTITEETIYGDQASYQAVYIAPGENTASISLTLYQGDNQEQKTFSQQNAGEEVTTEAFSLSQISDPLDPFCLVIVSDSKTESPFSSDNVGKEIWAKPGCYKIKVINRLGSHYEIPVVIRESDFAAISFTGEGTEETQDLLTSYGAQHVKLPSIARVGYNLVGFEDESGQLYSDEIAAVAFKGTVLLNAVWEAKQFNVTFQNHSGEVLKTIVMDFGKEYELPVPELPEGVKFLGWKLNGEVLDSNIITLENEGDITLVALVSNDTDAASEPEADQAEASSHALNGRMPIVAGCVVVLVIIFVVFAVSKIRSSKKKHDKSLNENKATISDDEWPDEFLDDDWPTEQGESDDE